MKTDTKSPKLALRLQQKLAERGVNPRQFSIQLGMAYDHVRKIVNGDVFPGPHALEKICTTLGLNQGEMDKLVKQDRAVDKGWVKAVTGKDQAWSRFETLWGALSEADKDELLALAKVKYERAQAAKSRKRSA